MKSTPQIEEKLKELETQGVLVPRTENNQYLKVSYKGAGGLVSPKWNIKIFTSGSMVCADKVVFHDLMEDKLKPPDPSLKVVQIDDAGIGFPLCGAMVGVCCDGRVVTDVVPVSFFQVAGKGYIQEYTDRGLRLLQKEFNPTPVTHRIEICTGYINKGLRRVLRDRKYDVRAGEIKGLLQDSLEGFFREFVKKETGGVDLGYDPKGLSKRDLCYYYYRAADWAKQNAPNLLKTAWDSLRE